MASIDIHSGKLTEWVVSRFQMNKDWSKKVSVIRHKITNALSDMPESEEIKKMIIGTYINYYHCLLILDILKATESSTRNIFGQYSSKRIKDWQEIIKLYEQNNAFLIDCSQILHQNVSFEIPALKKSIEKNNKTSKECLRKEKDYVCSINEASANLKRLGQRFSVDIGVVDQVDDDNIRIQLKKQTGNIQLLVSEMELKISTLREAYEAYSQFVHSNNTNNSSSDSVTKCCPLLSYLLENGNTTVYEWKYGKKPVVASAQILSHENEITAGVANKEDEISWDYVESNGIDDDYSIMDFGIEFEGESMDNIPANETKTLIEDQRMRDMVLDDLYEVDSFFNCCIDESSSDVCSILDSIHNFNDIWPNLKPDIVRVYRKHIKSFIDRFTDKDFVHLLMLESNPAYLESIVERFQRERSSLHKSINLVSLMKTRAIEAENETLEMTIRLDELRDQCKVLKGQIEESISKSFGNRPVKIIGEMLAI